uniref:Periviscerokinin-1 n=1 Tax=Ergaula capucina TaxID=76901 RepID=PVK1_ERGCA|nr:RecName: Full=Periviscerokinin-1; Short=ErgCa-PVK-1 [Ergaula capucina]
GSSGLISFPRT